MATPDRWAPWIELDREQNAGLTINSTAVVVVPNLSITFTPHIPTRIAVHWSLSATEGAFVAGSNLRTAARVSGVIKGRTSSAGFGGSIQVAGVTTFNLVKEATVTVEIVAELSVAGSSFSLNSGRGHMVVVAMPAIHAP